MTRYPHAFCAVCGGPIIAAAQKAVNGIAAAASHTSRVGYPPTAGTT